jgi:hypothetical protein
MKLHYVNQSPIGHPMNSLNKNLKEGASVLEMFQNNYLHKFVLIARIGQKKVSRKLKFKTLCKFLEGSRQKPWLCPA